MQYRAHLNVLKVQRELFADIGKLLAALLDLFSSERLDADYILSIRLVSQIIIFTAGLQRKFCAAFTHTRIDHFHRGCKIRHIKLALKAFGQRNIGKIDFDARPLNKHIDISLIVSQLDQQAPLPLVTATEIQVCNSVARRHSLVVGH